MHAIRDGVSLTKSAKDFPIRKIALGPSDTILDRRGDGAILIRSPHALGPHPAKLGERLVHWARETPGKIFLAKRDAGGTWRSLAYAQTLALVRTLGQALLDRGLCAQRPLAILSGNDLEHALLALAAMHVGVPYSPISPAYSLISTDHAKLRYILELLEPGVVFAANGERYAKAIAAAVPPGCELVVTEAGPAHRHATLFDALLNPPAGKGVDDAFAEVNPDTVAKILFTSGSTGQPKGVINTQRMLCSNQEMLATCANWEAGRAGMIGLPVAGQEMKLAPWGDKFEARFRGPNITPGYWKQPELTRAAFDDEGYYRMGDAVRFDDPDHPQKGLMFDGRLAEDFKLSSGSWVSVGPLRTQFLAAAAPFVQDVVVAGHDRDYIALLVFPRVDECRALCGLEQQATASEIITHDLVRTRFQALLDQLAIEATGGTTRIRRVLLLDVPPSIDAAEMTDKGSINQQAVLEHRATLVDEIYAATPSSRTLCANLKEAPH